MFGWLAHSSSRTWSQLTNTLLLLLLLLFLLLSDQFCFLFPPIAIAVSSSSSRYSFQRAGRARKTVKMHRLPDGAASLSMPCIPIPCGHFQLFISVCPLRPEMLSAPHMQQLAKQTRYHKIILICKTIASTHKHKQATTTTTAAS